MTQNFLLVTFGAKAHEDALSQRTTVPSHRK